MDFCPLDIVQKLAKQLLHLRAKILPTDDNIRLILKFTNLRSLYINFRGHSTKKKEFLEQILQLECLDTLSLANYEKSLPVIASGVEQGKLKLLQKLSIRTCPYASYDFLLLNPDYNTFERTQAEYFMKIAKSLQFIHYFEIVRTNYIYKKVFDTINYHIRDISKHCPNITFKVKIFDRKFLQPYRYNLLAFRMSQPMTVEQYNNIIKP